MNAPTVNVALVGINGYGGSYLNALLDGRGAGSSGQTGAGGNGNGSGNGNGNGSAIDGTGGYRLVGVVDPSAARSPRLPEVRDRGIPVHADLSSLYATTAVDLTLICTPIHLHASQSCTALAHRSNVLCEKPLAATADDALRVLAAERRQAGLFVSIGFQWSFSRAIQELKRDVMAGELGAARRLRTVVMFPRDENYYRRNAWAGRVTTEWGEQVFDSPLNNATAHYLHNMLYVLGATRETSAQPAWVEAELYRANDIESYDTAALRARMPGIGGAEVLFYTTHAIPERVGPVCRFEFERAVVEFDYFRGGQFVARFHDGRVCNYGQPELDRSQKIWQSVDAVRTGEPVACGARAALPHALCVGAAQASAQRIDFPASLRRRTAVDGEGSPGMVWIDGLSDGLLACYEQGVLPADLGLPWARAGRRVELPAVAARATPGLVTPFAAYV
jgi:predicted dehydrogenase